MTAAPQHESAHGRPPTTDELTWEALLSPDADASADGGAASTAQRSRRDRTTAQGRPARGTQPVAAGRGAARGRAGAGRGRRRLGQDPGADPPDRVPGGRAQGPPRLGPGHHVHQQGRRRDAAPGRRPDRQPREADVDLDLPLRVRPDPAQRDQPVRALAHLLDLRRRRLQAADAARADRSGAGPQEVPRPGGDELGLHQQERAGRPRDRGRPARRPRSRRATRRRTRTTSVAWRPPTRSTSTTSS